MTPGSQVHATTVIGNTSGYRQIIEYRIGINVSLVG